VISIKRLLLIILFLGVFLSFNIFLSSTEGELKEKFDSLLNLNFLSSQLTEPLTEWCYDFNSNIEYEDKGEEIKELKIALKKEGFIIEDSSEDFLDKETVTAVISFQEKYESEILAPSGLSHGSGHVGIATRKKLNELYGCTPISESSKKYNYSSATTENNTDNKTREGDPYKTSSLINGVCGSSNNLFFNKKPIYGLCSFGNATEITGNGPWYWVCSSPNGGTSVFCATSLIAPEEDSNSRELPTTGGEDDPANPPATNPNPGGGSVPEQLSVDLKINHSDKPSAVKFNSEFTASWTSTGAVNCSASSGEILLKEGGLWKDLSTLETYGSKILYASHDSYDYIVNPLTLGIQCVDSSGNIVIDSTSISVDSTINLFDINFPVSESNLVKGRTYNILWEGVEPGVTNYSVYLIGGTLNSADRLLIGTANSLSGSLSWTVPTNIEIGSYFQIQLDTTGEESGGAISGKFNIIATNEDLPDLVITEFSIVRKDPLKVEINYCLKNIGKSNTGKFYLMFSNLDNPLWGFFGAGFLGLGVDKEYCSEIIRDDVPFDERAWYIEGDNRIQITTDANIDIDESDESNNKSTYIFKNL